jgi:hypothetical protein
MEEIFKNIKKYLETSFTEEMLNSGGDGELVEQIKLLYLGNIEKMLEVARVYDGKKFTKTITQNEAKKFLQDAHNDFKKLFPDKDFEAGVIK